MNQRILATLLILIQAASFAYFSGAWLFPLLVGIGAVVALLLLAERRPVTDDRLGYSLLLALLFIIKYLLLPYDLPNAPTFALYPLAHATAQYFLALQVCLLFTQSPGVLLTPFLPLFGLLVFICLADLQMNTTQSMWYQIAALGFTVLSAYYYGAGRRVAAGISLSAGFGRSLIRMLTLVVALVAATVGSRYLERHWHQLDRWFAGVLGTAETRGTIGFSHQAQLGSIANQKSSSARTVALRIHASREPGYLRGASYDQYIGGRWESRALRSPFPAGQQASSGDVDKERETRFFLWPGAPEPWSTLEIWSAPHVDETIFAPLSAAEITLPTQWLERDTHGILRTAEPLALPHYQQRVAAPVEALATVPTPTDEYLQNLLRLPPHLVEHFQPLADEIFRDCGSTRDKLVAVERYFQTNYRYRLGIYVPPNQDPIEWFLKERPPAHCEFFASGAAVLLRLGNVPCRYVSGFVASEWNPIGRYWLARNQDAHAWVEAYVEGEGWRLVEATPAEGVPEVSQAVRPSHLWDDFLLRVQKIRAQLASQGWRGIFTALPDLFLALVTTVPGLLLTTGLLGWLTYRLRRLPRRSARAHRDFTYRELNLLLARMDRRVQRWGLERRPDETLHQFADRVEAKGTTFPAAGRSAAWYRRYADLRYTGETSGPLVEELRRQLASTEEP